GSFIGTWGTDACCSRCRGIAFDAFCGRVGWPKIGKPTTPSSAREPVQPKPARRTSPGPARAADARRRGGRQNGPATIEPRKRPSKWRCCCTQARPFSLRCQLKEFRSVDMMTSNDQEQLEQCTRACQRLKAQVGRVVVGQEAVLDLMLTALLARGHALLVGVPGLAKTLLVSSVAKSLALSFGRIQFTPDLLPADITGADVLSNSEAHRSLKFMEGPIFRNLVL